MVFRSVIGILAFLAIAWGMGTNRRRVSVRTVAAGVGLQVVLGAFLAGVREESPGYDPLTLEYLCKNYGTEYKRVLAIASEQEGLSEPVTADGEILAEVVFAARNEMAHTLKDILFRRTGLGTLGNPGDHVLTRAGEIAARELGWSDERLARELEGAREALRVP